MHTRTHTPTPINNTHESLLNMGIHTCTRTHAHARTHIHAQTHRGGIAHTQSLPNMDINTFTHTHMHTDIFPGLHVAHITQKVIQFCF